MTALILLSLYAVVGLILMLLAVSVKADEDTPVGLAVALGMLWLPIVVAVVLIAGTAALLRERA